MNASLSALGRLFSPDGFVPRRVCGLWPDWLVWLTRQSPTEVPARIPGEGPLKAIEDAPGSYVRARD